MLLYIQKEDDMDDLERAAHYMRASALATGFAGDWPAGMSAYRESLAQAWDEGTEAMCDEAVPYCDQERNPYRGER